jgi:membrane-associated phospholipid phosphatase
MKTCIKYLAVTLPIVVVLTGASILYFDREIALAMHGLLYDPEDIKSHASLGIYLTLCAYLAMLPVFAIYYFLRLIDLDKIKIMQLIRQLSLAFVFGYFIKDSLKFFFGRETVLHYSTGKLKFLVNPKNYGFHFFSPGADSFPSGHMTMICAIMVSIILIYPKLRVPSLLAIIIMAGALLIHNFHFMGDIIAGTYLGTTIALGVYYLGVYKNET